MGVDASNKHPHHFLFASFNSHAGNHHDLDHPGGCCTLVVDEDIPPLLCKAFLVSRKVLYKSNKLLLLLIIREDIIQFWALGSLFNSTGLRTPIVKPKKWEKRGESQGR